MATEAQINANRANAQLSTGPTTEAGKAASAANSTKHGLQANPTTLLENNPLERSRYDLLKSRLLDQIQPEGELELQTFERYVFALFQSDRARQHELDAQDRWSNEPNNLLWFQQMERIQRLGAMLERRADKALSEIRRLQRDRFASHEVANELFLLDKILPIPATLPIAEMRRTKQTQTSPTDIALQIIGNSSSCQSILKGETKPPEFVPITVTTEDLIRLHDQNKSGSQQKDH